MEIIPQTEIEVYKKEIVNAEKFGTTLVVKTDEDYHLALAEAKSIKERLEIIVKRKEEMTKPLNASLKSIRALFSPLETSLDIAYNVIKVKMVSFTDAKERKAEIADKRVEARLEKGTISEAEANVKKFMNQVPKSVANDMGTATTKKVKKYYVVDISKVPNEFVIVDMAKVRASFKAGYPVDGIEERLESELSIK